MPYLYTDKAKNETKLFKTISSLSKTLNIKIDNLYRVFSRNKLKTFENRYYRIDKKEMI